VNNALETAPEPATFDIVDGALPAGVTLDPDTGLVVGAFTEAGAFSASIRATNACGTADVTWTGTVAADPPADGPDAESNALPETGVAGVFAPLLGVGATALMKVGFLLIGSLVVLRRRHH
jgi:hypothetical protein